jgi:hypothetical protein
MLETARHDLFLQNELTRDAWNQFLRALDPDAVQAASRYERLRSRLIALYRGRGLPCPEDLADEALDRVACQLIRGRGLRTDIVGQLHAVAHRLADEASQRRRDQAEEELELTALSPPAGRNDDEVLAQLCQCLDDLPRADRRILIEYETGHGRERIRRRKALAVELGIPMNALRVRVHRLRARVIAMMNGAARPARAAVEARDAADGAADNDTEAEAAPAAPRVPAVTVVELRAAAVAAAAAARSRGDDRPETAGHATAARPSPTVRAAAAAQTPPLWLPAR